MKEGLKSVSISTDNVKFTPLCNTNEISLAVEEDNKLSDFIESLIPKEQIYEFTIVNDKGQHFKAKTDGKPKRDFISKKVRKGKRIIRKIKILSDYYIEMEGIYESNL
jgi:hypothetical protein